MQLRQAAVIAAMSFSLLGCTTIQDQVKNDRGAAVADCLARVKSSSQKFKAQAAAYMSVPKDRMPQIFCDRMADGVASGRINQSDINGLVETGQLTAKFRFLKG